MAILGPNGRGKTTLLKSIVGIYTPDEGKISVGGAFGYVPQNNDTPFAYKVLDMVVMGRARHIKYFRVPDTNDFSIARQSCQLLGISDLVDRPFNQLSGGERQLVLIARALASECQVLVLDEPASALDFQNQNTILSTLAKVAKERNLAILISTHFPQHALHLADSVLLMHSAEDYQIGSVNDVLTEENLHQLYSVPLKLVSIDYNGKTIDTVVPIFS